MYLVATIDEFSRYVVSWELDDTSKCGSFLARLTALSESQSR